MYSPSCTAHQCIVSETLKHSVILWSGSILGGLEVMALHRERARAPCPQLEMASALMGCSSGMGGAVTHSWVPSWWLGSKKNPPGFVGFVGFVSPSPYCSLEPEESIGAGLVGGTELWRGLTGCLYPSWAVLEASGNTCFMARCSSFLNK